MADTVERSQRSNDEPSVAAATEPAAPAGVRHKNGGAADGRKAAGKTSSDSFARDLLTALVRFRDGDFSSRMPADLVGVEGKIADVFNDISSTSSRRTQE